MSKEIAIRTGVSSPPLLFRQVSPGPRDSTLQFRLLHFWDARKNVKGGPGILLGIEMLMIDTEGTLAQGFIGQNRRNQYEKELHRGSIYTLTNYYASNRKVMYHVADQRLVICISHASAMSKDEEDIDDILRERFRVRSFSEFEANCDLRGDLHDVVGHLKLVDGQALHQRPVLCTNDDSASRKVMVHLQLKDGPVMNVYLWDEAAESFRLKFDGSAATPTVLLVTTINPKRLGGNLSHSKYEFLITHRQESNRENGGDAAEIEVPLPQCFIDAIGQTKKLRIKVAHYNFTSTRLSLTATKVVSAAELPPKNSPLKTTPVTEVENTELAESSGGGASAIDDQKKAKRAKRSG
ncbi:unnamed protein product [Brassica oleracea var. botrytis]|uniref:(rape) hypothetical protein n=1 Tax=Brassica napus TaxID=3708 RepID=A0A078FYI8_BRANA|nr:unnamed protein product [Brassica napus]CDY18036.1 BnaC07g04340D [Brassica napus]